MGSSGAEQDPRDDASLPVLEPVVSPRLPTYPPTHLPTYPLSPFTHPPPTTFPFPLSPFTHPPPTTFPFPHPSTHRPTDTVHSRTSPLLAYPPPTHRPPTHTLIHVIRSVPTDCPQRERRGWMGDAQASCDEAMQNFDMMAFCKDVNIETRMRWLTDRQTCPRFGHAGAASMNDRPSSSNTPSPALTRTSAINSRLTSSCFPVVGRLPVSPSPGLAQSLVLPCGPLALHLHYGSAHPTMTRLIPLPSCSSRSSRSHPVTRPPSHGTFRSHPIPLQSHPAPTPRMPHPAQTLSSFTRYGMTSSGTLATTRMTRARSPMSCRSTGSGATPGARCGRWVPAWPCGDRAVTMAM